MALIAEVDLEVIRGDTLRAFRVTVTGEGQDFTGAAAQAEFVSANGIYVVTLDPPVAVVSAEECHFDISLSAAQTAEFPTPSGRWDCKVKTPAGVVTSIAGGKLTVLPSVTRGP